MIPQALRRHLQQTLARVKQALRAANRRRLQRRRVAGRTGYADWVQRHDTLDAAALQSLHRRLQALPRRPRVSVLVPVHNPDLPGLDETIASLTAQLYPDWQLCVADDGSTDPAVFTRLQHLAQQDARVRVSRLKTAGRVCRATNSALELADGEWVALLDAGDTLAPHALLLLAEAACALPAARLIYSDEDRLGPNGEREDPWFKPDWNHDLCLGHNLAGHVTALHTDLMRELGGLRPGLEGAAHHDLVLRCAERLRPQQIVHVPHVLYHTRARAGRPAEGAETVSDAPEDSCRAVQDHLQRRGVAGASVQWVGPDHCRVQWPLPHPAPRVSLIIPTRNQRTLLHNCIRSLDRHCDYPDVETLIIDNGSDQPDALDYLLSLESRARTRVLRLPGPFNFSALNNAAARAASGSVLALLNDDTEATHADWLREMVAQSLRPEVGAVGAKLLYPDGTVQHAGIVLGIDRGDGFGGVAAVAHRGVPGQARGYAGRAVRAQQFAAVTAACLVIERRKWDAVSGLDEQHLAVAYNDVDLGLRLNEAGYVNVWTPHACLVHHESVSRGRDLAPARRERFLRERAYMLQRWGDRLARDGAYNLNLSLSQADFSLAEPPRHTWATPWFVRAAGGDNAPPSSAGTPP